MNAKRDIAGACLLAVALFDGSVAAQAETARERSTAPRRSAVEKLSSIVVTPTASMRNQDDAPASMTIVDGEGLRTRPVNDMADALRDATGVSLENVGLGRRGISIRGMGSGHTLMLVDGQRISTSASAIAHSDFELGWVPTEAIDRIEVVRGPMSSLYGSDALGGVVNVITRVPARQWHGSFSGYGLFAGSALGGNQYKSAFYVGGPLMPDRLSLSVWGEAKRRDSLKNAGNTGLTMLDAQRASSGHVGLSVTPDRRQRIDLSLDAGNEHLAGTRQGARGPAYDAENAAQRRRYALSHTGNWDWGSSRVRLYRSTLHRDSRRSDGADLSGPNHLTDTVLDARVGITADTAHSLTFAGEMRRESVADPSINRRGKRALTHHAFMVQDELTLARQWELILGGRVDHHQDFGWQASPRAYMLFHATDDLTFKAGVGRGFKAPSLKQLSSQYESRAAMGGRGIIRGNPDLRPEVSQSMELAASYTGYGWSTAATLFHNDVRNLIETVRLPTCAERNRICLAYENVARTRLRGIELEGTADISRQWRVAGHYTYLDARDRNTGEPLADRSRHRASATLTWMPLAQVASRVQVEYIGAQYRGGSEGRRPGQMQLHWYADYRINRQVSVHVGIENLTDRRLANDDASLYGRADEGRRYFAGLTAKF